jgi:hypothetical protein
MPSYLAFVTLYVKAPIQSDNTNSFFLSRLWHDGIVTNRAARSEFPATTYIQFKRRFVKKQEITIVLVEIVNAVNPVGGINRERNAVQTE